MVTTTSIANILNRAGAAPQLANLSPLAQLLAGRLPRRLAQLMIGLVIYGISMAMMGRGTLGLDPWDVFHFGVASRLPLTFGGVVIVTAVAVLLLWIPLRQMPGFGTIANAIVIGIATDAALAVIVEPSAHAARVGLLLGGVGLNALATALYIGSQFGPGPRDGLMIGLVRRTSWVRASRPHVARADGDRRGLIARRSRRSRDNRLRAGDRSAGPAVAADLHRRPDGVRSTGVVVRVARARR